MKSRFVPDTMLAPLASLLLVCATAQAQPYGNALSFNGANNYVSFTIPAPPMPNDYTICAWVYLYSGGTYGGTRMAVLGGTGCGDSIEFMIRSSTENPTQPQYLELGRCSSFDGVPSTTAVPLNTWTHVAVSVSLSLGVSYYVNGNAAGTWSGAGDNFAFGTTVQLGDNNGGRAFNGMLNNVQIWNTVLSQSQIQNYMNHPPTGNESGLYAYYPLREGSGSKTADAATAQGGSTGALVNSPLWTPIGVSITTLPATSVTNPNATLNGTATNGSQPGVAYFQWGLTANYGDTSTPIVLPTLGTTNFSNQLTGLASAQYHYRAVVSNAYGIAVGPDVTFWPIVISLNGANPLTNECHTAFTDPGANVIGLPIALACGTFGDLALRTDGSVSSWKGPEYQSGEDYGQLNVPGGLTNVVVVSAGIFNSLALRSNGTVAAWGRNTSGAGSVVNGIAIAAGAYHGVAAEANGSVLAWGDNTYSQTVVPTSATNVIALAAGSYHTLALSASGNVVAWGAGTVDTPSDYTDYGQSIVPANATNITAVAAGSYHSLALTASGTVLAWGAGTTYNPSDLASYGQCIVPASATNVVAIAGGSTYSVALRSDGSVIAWGDNTYGQTTIPSAVTNIAAIAAGGYHTFALRNDGTWIGWGDELALGSAATNVSTILASSGSVQTNVPGNYTLTYNFTNAFSASLAREVVVADRTPPALTLIGANPFYLTQGATYIEPGYSAPDACEGNLTSDVIVTGSVNTSDLGTNMLTYTVTDASGNTATTNRNVIVTGAPSVLGLAAQVVGTNSINGTRSVSISAIVNPDGLAGTCVFQYGLNTSYPGTTSAASFGASFNTTTVSQSISNLVAGVAYHFRAVATNTNGSMTSSDYAFYIPSIYPVGDLNGDGIVDQYEFNLVLSNYLATSPYLLITNAAGLGQTNVTFALSNTVAGVFSVEESTDLINWEYVGPADPFYQFTDTNATSASLRYYRLRFP